MSDEQQTPTEIKKMAMRKYQNEFYERNKERLREDKLVGYYKREYGLNFLTKENLKSFKEHKATYLAILDNDNMLNKDIVSQIIKLKYSGLQTHQ
jgi:hypothetical protein